MAEALQEEKEKSSQFLNPVLDHEAKVQFLQGIWQRGSYDVQRDCSEASVAPPVHMVDTGVDCLARTNPRFKFV
jgi:hypothetical protein